MSAAFSEACEAIVKISIPNFYATKRGDVKDAFEFMAGW